MDDTPKTKRAILAIAAAATSPTTDNRKEFTDAFADIAAMERKLAALTALIEKMEPESIERRKKEWAALDTVIVTYADDYEYGDEGYTPSKIELAICHDFLQGLIANEDFMAAIAKVYPVRSLYALPADLLALLREGTS